MKYWIGSIICAFISIATGDIGFLALGLILTTLGSISERH